jgi:hypothetical protein
MNFSVEDPNPDVAAELLYRDKFFVLWTKKPYWNEIKFTTVQDEKSAKRMYIFDLPSSLGT